MDIGNLPRNPFKDNYISVVFVRSQSFILEARGQPAIPCLASSEEPQELNGIP